MEKKRSIWKWIALIFIIVAVGAAGILIGRNMAASKYQAEQELNYKLNRSDLDGLGDIDGPIYVTGHKSPDADTEGSSIGYAALLQKLGYESIKDIVLEQMKTQDLSFRNIIKLKSVPIQKKVIQFRKKE